MEKEIKKTKKWYKRKVLIIPIVLFFCIFIVSGAVYIKNTQRVAGVKNVINNPLTSEKRHAYTNSTDDEVAYIGQSGNISTTGNLDVSLTGYFKWIGSVANKVTFGWFESAQIDYLNSTTSNSSNFYQGGNRVIDSSDESDLNINSSNYWDDLDTPLDSWLSTYNATYDSKTPGNLSWNESYADGLYSMDYTDLALINQTNTFTPRQLFSGGLNASNGVNILGNYPMKWWDNTGATQYSYTTATTSGYIFSAVDVPMLFQYGSLGSHVGLYMDTDGIINISKNTYFGENIYPQTTLSSDIGSGTNRFSTLYVQNISAEDINTYNLIASINVTSDNYCNSTNCYSIGQLLNNTEGSINYTLETFNAYNSTWDNRALINAISGGNASWNQSLTDTLYAPNTTAGIQSLINSTGVYSTYNATYHDKNSSKWINDGNDIYYDLGNVEVINFTLEDKLTYLGAEFFISNGTDNYLEFNNEGDIAFTKKVYFDNVDLIFENSSEDETFSVEAETGDVTLEGKLIYSGESLVIGNSTDDFMDFINEGDMAFMKDVYFDNSDLIFENASEDETFLVEAETGDVTSAGIICDSVGCIGGGSGGGLFGTNGTSVYNDTALAFGFGIPNPTNFFEINKDFDGSTSLVIENANSGVNSQAMLQVQSESAKGQFLVTSLLNSNAPNTVALIADSETSQLLYLIDNATGYHNFQIDSNDIIRIDSEGISLSGNITFETESEGVNFNSVLNFWDTASSSYVASFDDAGIISYGEFVVVDNPTDENDLFSVDEESAWFFRNLTFDVSTNGEAFYIKNETDNFIEFLNEGEIGSYFDWYMIEHDLTFENETDETILLEAETGDITSVGVICDSGGTNCIGDSSGNASWNESLADTLYAKYQFINNNFNGSGNFTTSDKIGIGTEDMEFDLDIRNTYASLGFLSDDDSMLVMTAYNEDSYLFSKSGGKIYFGNISDYSFGATTENWFYFDYDGINATGKNITADTYFGDGSQLTGISGGDASYQFTNNNFNGSGNFITTGKIGLGTEEINWSVDIRDSVPALGILADDGSHAIFAQYLNVTYLDTSPEGKFSIGETGGYDPNIATTEWFNFTSEGINANNVNVSASYFKGDGSLLTGISLSGLWETANNKIYNSTTEGFGIGTDEVNFTADIRGAVPSLGLYDETNGKYTILTHYDDKSYYSVFPNGVISFGELDSYESTGGLTEWMNFSAEGINLQSNISWGDIKLYRDSVQSLTVGGRALRLTNDGNVFLQINRYSSDLSHPLISFRKARGTQASPEAILNQTRLGSFDFEGYDGLGFGATAKMGARAVEDFATFTNKGTELYFSTTPLGSVTPIERITISSELDGIEFGLSKDTNLYRSSANILKTDDSFNVGGNLTFGASDFFYMGNATDDFLEFNNEGEIGFFDWLFVAGDGASAENSTENEVFSLDKETGDINIEGDYYQGGIQGFTGTCINTTYQGGIAVSCND